MFFAGPSQPAGQALESSTEALLVQTPVHTRHDPLDPSTQSVVLRAAAPASPGSCPTPVLLTQNLHVCFQDAQVICRHIESLGGTVPGVFRTSS